MKPGLKIGHQFEFSAQVTDAMKARFQDGVVHDLYATASMITHMEWAARQHILPFLEKGEEGVGYHVDVKHLNPTPVGAVVRIKSTVTDIEPGKITSHVEAWHLDGSDDQVKIGDGSFTQAIISIQKLHERISQHEAPPAVLNGASKSQKKDTETVSDRPDAPPPAILSSMDGQIQFCFEVLSWENPLPCTRYDEWLVCRAALKSTSRQNTQEGPFLLRFEIEEWIHGLEEVLRGNTYEFQSDFMEPRLKFDMIAMREARFQVAIQLSEHSQPGKESMAEVQAEFRFTVDSLQLFIRQMTLQMEGFYSKI
jgi:fluoroacetyl-CoA thioesterase